MPSSFLETVWSTADFSPPLVQMAAGGVDLAPGAHTVLDVNPSRVKALIQHCGDSGKLWIRFDGAAAAPGIGELLLPGEQWFEFTTAAVSVFYEGSGTCRVTTSELGT